MHPAYFAQKIANPLIGNVLDYGLGQQKLAGDQSDRMLQYFLTGQQKGVDFQNLLGLEELKGRKATDLAKYTADLTGGNDLMKEWFKSQLPGNQSMVDSRVASQAKYFGDLEDAGKLPQGFTQHFLATQGGFNVSGGAPSGPPSFEDADKALTAKIPNFAAMPDAQRQQLRMQYLQQLGH